LRRFPLKLLAVLNAFVFIIKCSEIHLFSTEEVINLAAIQAPELIDPTEDIN
jgi:hypothetical protein